MFRRPVIVLPPPAAPVPTRAARWWMRLRRLFRVALWTTATAVVGSVALLTAAFAWSVPAPSPAARSVGVNALWARHSWAGEAHGDGELDRFAARLRGARISDVFAHVGPFEADGSVPASSHPHGAELVSALHRRAPGVRVQAQLDGMVRLEDRAVRDRMVATAAALLDAGFDGVQYDLRSARSGDPAFLDLLTRTRAVTGTRGAVLSVALEDLAAHPALAAVLGQPDAAALDAVADRVDQLAVRTYDSGLPTASAFAAWQAWQTVRVASVVSDRVTLFMGVGTDPADGAAHHPWAESMASGLHGLRRGLDSLGPARASMQPIGAAVFAEWTTTDEDWRRFGDEWLDPPA